MTSPGRHGHLLAAVVAAAAALAPPAGAACYGANTTSFSWCTGYAKAGYNCFGDMCASGTCLGMCEVCAVLYTEATLNPTTGQCCSPGNQGGQCTNPRPGVVHETSYGFPDHHPGAIFEGSVQYTHGPPVWSPQAPSGDYGFIMLPAGLGNITKDSESLSARPSQASCASTAAAQCPCRLGVMMRGTPHSGGVSSAATRMRWSGLA